MRTAQLFKDFFIASHPYDTLCIPLHGINDPW
jgi:hypothetical protein